MAERAFVRSKDYPGVHFIRRLASISSKGQQEAEIAAYFGHFDEAEAAYIRLGREDLAIALRRSLGDWTRVG